jgi:hypothetical protein
MAMVEGEPPIDRAGLASPIEHPARECIVEALRWVGPLSVPDLKVVLDDPELHLASIAYHVAALVGEEVLIEIGQRPVGASLEKVYVLASPK